MLDSADLSERLRRVRAMLEERDLDAVIAVDLSHDEILLGNQRWLTGFAPIGQPAAAIVFRDGRVELVSPMLGRTAPAFYAASGLPIEPVPGALALVAERIGRAALKRVGFAESATMPAVLWQALSASHSAPELVDVSTEFTKLRLIKSDAELAAVRQSCAIADLVWARVPDIFRLGRKIYEVLADVDHLVKLAGGESGFYLLARLPILGLSMEVMADPEVIEPGTRYMLEISPRYQGYYSQLTAPVVTGTDDAVGEAYADLVASKAFAQPLMVPGADLTEIAGQIEEFLKARGRIMASRSLGHFCGMALEEPRHDPTKPFVLECGMTMIFHPVLASPELMSLMRADTYTITGAGAERLNAHPMDLLQID